MRIVTAVETTDMGDNRQVRIPLGAEGRNRRIRNKRISLRQTLRRYLASLRAHRIDNYGRLEHHAHAKRKQPTPQLKRREARREDMPFTRSRGPDLCFASQAPVGAKGLKLLSLLPLSLCLSLSHSLSLTFSPRSLHLPPPLNISLHPYLRVRAGVSTPIQLLPHHRRTPAPKNPTLPRRYCPHRDKSRSVMSRRSRARAVAASVILLRAASGDATSRKSSSLSSREDGVTAPRSNVSRTFLRA